jgi:2-phosphosulfolactate phosphatase
MPLVHFIEGDAGCRYAADEGAVAIVVDALRASATAAMLLHHGATELLVTSTVEDARAAKEAWPDALLAGERGGLPPAGFDCGNSPAEAALAAGRRVIFTTTTGAGRLVAAWGAHAAYMGSPVNAAAVASMAASHGVDIVVIAAGLMSDPNFDAQEDRVGAAYLASCIGWPLGEGAEICAHWQERIQTEGLDRLFDTAPHAAELRRIGQGSDVPLCASADLTTAVPVALVRLPLGVLVGRAGIACD